MTHIEIRCAQAIDRLPIYRMLELYQYELSDIWDQELDAHGEYGYALDRFWNSKNCSAYVAKVGGHYAGFALVDTAVKVGSQGHWMDQFFVLKKYRRSGLGTALARHVFSALLGAWEVGQMLNNHSARAFWQRVLAEYTDGQFAEHKLAGGWWEGFIQCFVSAPK